MKTLISIILLTVSFASSNAQINTFKILTMSGQSIIKVGQNSNELKTGMVLSGDFSIEIGDGSYLGLVHNSGNILEIRESGIYDARDLYIKANTGKSNTLATKYTDYLLNKMEESASDRRLSATGAVERAFDPLSKEVNLFMSDMNEFLGEEVIIEWERPDEVSTIEVLDMYENILYTTEMKGKRYVLNMKEASLEEQNMFLVKVKQGTDRESTAVLLKKVAEAAREKHTNNLDEITSNISNSALLELIRAAYFEDNKLLVDAFTAYVNAMMMEPEVMDYQDAYRAFLVRNRLLQNI